MGDVVMDICAATKPGEPWLYCCLWEHDDAKDHVWVWKPEHR